MNDDEKTKAFVSRLLPTINEAADDLEMGTESVAINLCLIAIAIAAVGGANEGQEQIVKGMQSGP